MSRVPQFLRQVVDGTVILAVSTVDHLLACYHINSTALSSRGPSALLLFSKGSLNIQRPSVDMGDFGYPLEQLVRAFQGDISLDLPTFQNELDSRKEFLSQCLDLYKKPNPESRKKVESEDLVVTGQKISRDEKQLREFVLKTSALLDLDELQTLDIVFRTLLQDVHLPAALRKYNTDKPAYDDRLLAAVTEFYLQERHLTVELLKVALQEVLSEENPLYPIVMPFLESAGIMTAKNDGFRDRILGQIRTAYKSRVSVDAAINPTWARHWAGQFLREQQGLLEVIFLLLYHTCPPRAAVAVTKTLVAINFGRGQPNASIFDAEMLAQHALVCDLCVLVAIEVMNLEFIMDDSKIIRSVKEEDATMLVEYLPAVLEVAEALTTSFPAHSTMGHNAQGSGAVMMALALLLLRLKVVAAYGNSPQFNRVAREEWLQQLLQRAYCELQGMQYLVRLQDGPCYGGNEHVTLAFRSVIKGLLMLLCTIEDAPSLPDRDVLVRCLSQAFGGVSELCHQFWELDFPIEERRSLLDSASRHYPLEASQLLNLLRSLIGDEQTAKYVFQYTKSLKSFPDYCRARDYMDTEQLNVVEWVGKGGLVHGAKQLPFHPPPGTRGQTVGTEGVILKFKYSGWHLFLSLVDSFLHQWGSGGDGGILAVTGTQEIVTQHLNLVNSILKEADEELFHAFMYHLDEYPGGYPPTFGSDMSERLVAIISLLLNRCCSFPQPPTELLTSCLSCLSLLLRHFPDHVWKHLRAQTLFPRHSPVTATGQYMSGSYMEQTLLPAERAAGRYPTTLAYLDLLHELVNNAQILEPRTHMLSEGDRELEPGFWEAQRSPAAMAAFEARIGGAQKRRELEERLTAYAKGRELALIKSEVLYSSIVYVHREIFPTYNLWRYVRVADKMAIGHKILQIFNSVTRDSSWTHLDPPPEGQRLIDFSLLQEYLYRSYLEEGSLYQITPLLDIIALGKEEPEKLVRMHRQPEARAVEGSIKEALTFLQRLLLWAKVNRGAITLLEHVLLDHTARTKGPNGPVELVHVIGSYIKYEFNVSLPLLSTQVLTLLCMIAADWDPRPPSLIGYFGAEARGIVNAFVQHLSTDFIRNENLTELQTSIFNFVATVVKTQPGLAAMFLTTDEAQGHKGRSVLSVLLDMLKHSDTWQYLVMKKPTVLPAGMGLLDTLWQSAPDYPGVLNNFRSNPDFWGAFASILEYRIDSDIEDADMQSVLPCCLQQVQAHILRILALEVYFAKTSATVLDGQSQGQGPVSRLDSKILNVFKRLVSKSMALFLGKSLPFDASRTIDMKEAAAAINPPVDMASYRVLTWDDALGTGRRYGSNYIYDFDLLVRKFDRSLRESSDQEQYLALFQSVRLVNLNWSETDAHIVLVRSWSCCIKIATHRLNDLLWSAGLAGTQERIKYLEGLVEKLGEALKAATGEEDIVIKYRFDLCSLLEFLVGKLAAAMKLSPGISTNLERLRNVIPLLRDAMEIAQYPLGPVGQFSCYEFHKPLLNTSLVTIRAMHTRRNSASASNPEIEKEWSACSSACRGYLPTVCKGLANLLAGLVTDSFQGDQQEVATLISILSELVRPDFGIQPSHWLLEMERHEIIPLILAVFSKSVSVTTETPSYAIEALNLLLVLAATPMAAERLATRGLLVCFCNNSLSPPLMNGEVEPYEGLDRNPWHRVWCLMVAIVSNVLQHLGNSRNFLQEVTGFIRLYQNQIARAISVREGALSIGRTEEMIQITSLFWVLENWAEGWERESKADPQQVDEPVWSVLTHYQGYALRILNDFVYLFNSQNDLESRIFATPKEERETGRGETETDRDSAAEDGREDPSRRRLVVRGVVEGRMLVIIRNVVSFLRISTGSGTILNTQNRNEWDLDNRVFVPSMRSPGEDGPTMGSLFDLLRHMAGIIKKLSDASASAGRSKGKGPADQPPPAQQANMPGCSAKNAVLIAETGLVLAASQLALYNACGELATADNDVVGEMLSTLRDLDALLRDATQKDKLGMKLEGWSGTDIEETKYLVECVETFIIRERLNVDSGTGRTMGR
ncbi:hypothetical protein HK104_008803 [Borealophlyctis nickersoniae]|nr:hypothetical protein HK104_008803 [Borealophlyctis nickersoniae]